MRILDLRLLPRIPIADHGSAGFTLGPLAAGADVTVVAVRLSPGGRIGRHPTDGGQLLVLLEGSARVSGSDAVEHELDAGGAVLWAPGELHETVSPTGALALVLEGDLTLRS